MMHNTKVSLIVAISKDRGIGFENKLLWKIPDDLKRFHDITTGHPIIMGRKTFESIGRVLPGRKNIVITRDSTFKYNDIVVVNSLEEAIKYASNVILSEREGSRDSSFIQNDIHYQEMFIIGGGQIFQQAIGLADKLYLTIIDAAEKADTYFPDYPDFKKVVFEEERGYKGIKYKFLDLERG
ncbi:MAG: dihydrofolate reductase [bacterium]|nr:dihydrofolate reductase [bacterium]